MRAGARPSFTGAQSPLHPKQCGRPSSLTSTFWSCSPGWDIFFPEEPNAGNKSVRLQLSNSVCAPEAPRLQFVSCADAAGKRKKEKKKKKVCCLVWSWTRNDHNLALRPFSTCPKKLFALKKKRERGRLKMINYTDGESLTPSIALDMS